MLSARITGSGSYLPSKVLTNKDLEEIVDTTEDWIYSRSGIRQRHIAAREALQSAGRAPSDVDLIVVATTTADQVFPSTACLLQQRLGIHGCPAFDVQAVCAGFLYALDVVYRYVATGASQ
ncbi:MAG: 3-oxoacyl-ACP synthase, partial [Arenicellales bacterium]